MIDLLSSIATIDCAGRFRNNTDALKRDFADNKLRYLSGYRFNICPENSLGSGYTTEKVFEAIAAGCIPIYWGAYLEPGILNSEAILRYELGQEDKLYHRVQQLWQDYAAYEAFAQLPPFVDTAAEQIWSIFEGLRAKLDPILR